ncbi:hypothetical protein [Nocardioides aequoreus]|uniref:hypothetical protein n=1 Tax=Nocardioides aequoreus TaxID=397278 RepID=UPI0012F6CB8F|nr:hypothetical protein [Nocardioides aequoreus]
MLLYDVRAEPGPAEIADALAARSMREDLRRYLIEDREQLIQAERQRRRRTDVEAWIRSAVDGPDEAPDKVDVELASVTTLAEGLSYWDTRRYVVVWEDEGWRLQDTILSNTGPGGDQPLTSQQRRDYLTGTGWRRIPPA